jgi:hypothetical protein
MVERGDYEGAVEQYRMALESAPPDWEHGEQVRTDLEAVLGFIEDGGD